MNAVSFDRERAAVTARSVLANVDVLEGEGLDAARQAAVVELGERLAAESTDGAVDDVDAVGTARGLREVLAGLDGSTSRTLVAWLDDVLDPEG